MTQLPVEITKQGRAAPHAYPARTDFFGHNRSALILAIYLYLGAILISQNRQPAETPLLDSMIVKRSR